MTGTRMGVTSHIALRRARDLTVDLLFACAGGLYFGLRAGFWAGVFAFFCVWAGLATVYLAAEVVNGIQTAEWRARAWPIFGLTAFVATFWIAIIALGLPPMFALGIVALGGVILFIRVVFELRDWWRSKRDRGSRAD